MHTCTYTKYIRRYLSDSEIDVISDARDTSITVESKDSDVSMTSLKSSKSTSPSDNSSTGSPSTISPEDGCRKKTRTNYTPVQVQTLEKVSQYRNICILILILKVYKDLFLYAIRC